MWNTPIAIALGKEGERPVGPVSENMVESDRRRQPLLTPGLYAQGHVCGHTETLTAHTHIL